jgi:hypothetical protein
MQSSKKDYKSKVLLTSDSSFKAKVSAMCNFDETLYDTIIGKLDKTKCCIIISDIIGGQSYDFSVGTSYKYNFKHFHNSESTRIVITHVDYKIVKMVKTVLYESNIVNYTVKLIFYLPEGGLVIKNPYMYSKNCSPNDIYLVINNMEKSINVNIEQILKMLNTFSSDVQKRIVFDSLMNDENIKLVESCSIPLILSVFKDDEERIIVFDRFKVHIKNLTFGVMFNIIFSFKKNERRFIVFTQINNKLVENLTMIEIANIVNKFTDTKTRYGALNCLMTNNMIESIKFDQVECLFKNIEGDLFKNYVLAKLLGCGKCFGVDEMVLILDKYAIDEVRLDAFNKLIQNKKISFIN